jgi:hypothetical protein
MEPKVYFKQVAVIQGRFFSVYDKDTEYTLGITLSQSVAKGHKGGFYVYSSAELAANAKIAMKMGSNWIFPRTILEVECWGNMIQYPRFKLCFEFIKPIQNIGFPNKYLISHRNHRENISNLSKMKLETNKLEEEVAEMERKARMLGII